MFSDEQIKNWFTYHSPTPEQQKQYVAINDAAYNLAIAIRDNTPSCADQSAALRQVREARMTANAAIACKGN